MKTIILRISEKSLGPASTYKLEVIDVRWADGKWSETVEGSRDIPADQLDGPADVGSPPAAAAPAPVLAAAAPAAGPMMAEDENRDVGPRKGAGGGTAREASDAAALFDLVFQQDVSQAWDRLIRKPGGVGQAEDFRLILDLAAQPLRRRRWERMGKDPVYLGCKPRSSLVRGPVDLTYRAPMLDGPIKVLVVVGSAVSEEPAVRAEDEVRALEEAFKDLPQGLEYEVLRRPTRESLSAAIVALQPDVFHFIGHGRLVNGVPQLLLQYETAPPPGLPWELADILKDFRGVSPSFVFLNACHTVAETEVPEAWSMSDLFVGELGARAVLGMHAAVRGTTAGKLAASLYRALVQGKSLDLAVTDARCDADILRGNDPGRQFDWALPYLRLTVLPDQVLPLAPAVPQEVCDKIRQVTEFQDNPYFVDRTEPRKRFALQIQPKVGSYLILVAGEKGIGKTHLIRTCLEDVALKGRLLKYVVLDNNKAYDVLDVLQLLCTGDDWSPIGAPLPPKAMKHFARVHNALLAGENADDPEVLAKSPTALTWKPLPTDARSKTEDPVKSLVGGFLKSLQSVAAEAREAWAGELKDQFPEDADRARRDQRPFLLVLDQVSLNPNQAGRDALVTKAFKEALVPYLVKPLARGAVKDLRLALAVAPEDRQAFGLDDKTLGLTPKSVAISKFKPDEFSVLLEEYLTKRKAFTSYENSNLDPAILRGILTNTAQLYKKKNESWAPGEIQAFYQMYVTRFVGQTP